MSYILTMNQLGGGGVVVMVVAAVCLCLIIGGGGGGGCLLCCRLDVNAMDDRVLVSADLLTVYFVCNRKKNDFSPVHKIHKPSPTVLQLSLSQLNQRAQSCASAMHKLAC